MHPPLCNLHIVHTAQEGWDFVPNYCHAPEYCVWAWS